MDTKGDWTVGNSARKNLITMTALNGLFYFAWAWGCYQTVYLQNNGMTSADIGILNAVSSVVAIFAATFWGIISDKINSIKITSIANFVILAITTALLPFLPARGTYATGMFIAYCAVITFTRSPSFTLMDNITVRNCAAGGLSYGAVRSFGSVTYTIGSVIISLLLPYIGVGSTFWIYGILMIPTIICLTRCNDPKVITGGKKAGLDRESMKQLFSNYYYITFLLFIMLYFIPRTAEYSFVSYFMEERGIPLDNMGILLAVRAAVEVPFLFFIGVIRKRFKLKHLLMIASLFVAVECLGLGLMADDFGSLLFFSSFFGMGNGIFMGVVSDYLFRLAPDAVKATAQSIYASVSAASSIIGNLLGGFAYAALGGMVFYVVMGVIVLISVAMLGATLYIGQKKGISHPADEI